MRARAGERHLWCNRHLRIFTRGHELDGGREKTRGRGRDDEIRPPAWMDQLSPISLHLSAYELTTTAETRRGSGLLREL